MVCNDLFGLWKVKKCSTKHSPEYAEWRFSNDEPNKGNAIRKCRVIQFTWFSHTHTPINKHTAYQWISYRNKEHFCYVISSSTKPNRITYLVPSLLLDFVLEAFHSIFNNYFYICAPISYAFIAKGVIANKKQRKKNN